MSLIALATQIVERTKLPDAATAAGIEFLCTRTRRLLSRRDPGSERRFAASMPDWPIAEFTDRANAQHYEVPAEFFSLVLGPRRKYSCCLYENETDTLAIAEERALLETARNADLADGQRILELGCGWGSLSLWMAEHFPRADITAVSNSSSQRAYITETASRKGLRNLRVITADMNAFSPDAMFDRVVSVEMFEHMSNWPALLGRVRNWLAPGGSLFLHVFSHRSASYRFDHRDREDWIAQHFFTGGLMPSHGLIRHFPDLFEVTHEWQWSGTHYKRTALDWLANFDRQSAALRPILEQTYGRDAAVWHRRWRLFFLATAGLFGHAGGTEWGVSHYRLRPACSTADAVSTTDFLAAPT
jgi:cyclopropane-fatty-acyl-phospholipid synthase